MEERKRDIKYILGGGYRDPEVQAILQAELRATVTKEAVKDLYGLDDLMEAQPERETSGLIEWHRMLAKGYARLAEKQYAKALADIEFTVGF